MSGRAAAASVTAAAAVRARGRARVAVVAVMLLAFAGRGAAADEDAVGALLAAERFQDAYVAAVAGQHDDPAALAAAARAFLTEALQGTDSYPRWFALRALRNVPDPEMGPLVQALATSGDRYVESLALEVLASTDAAAYRETFAAALQSPHRPVRLRALHGLGHLEDPAVVAPLVEVLRADSDPELRALAARQLARVGRRDALEPLAAALDDPSPIVQGEAVRALVALGDAEVGNRLRQRLAAAEPGDRLSTVRLMALVPDPTLARDLAPLLGSDHAELRLTAAGAVLAVQGPRRTP